MLPFLTIFFGFVAIVAFIVSMEEPSSILVSFIAIVISIASGYQSVQTISTTNTFIPGTVVKTPNAVIAEIRVGDRIERATFTDIATYQRATPETRIIWRVTENSWGKSGVIVLDLP